MPHVRTWKFSSIFAARRRRHYSIPDRGDAGGHGDSVGYERLVRDIAKSIDKACVYRLVEAAAGKQIDYALGDVTICAKYARLAKRLDDTDGGRLSEEMDILTDTATYLIAPEDAWKRLKPVAASRYSLYVVRWLRMRSRHRTTMCRETAC